MLVEALSTDITDVPSDFFTSRSPVMVVAPVMPVAPLMVVAPAESAPVTLALASVAAPDTRVPVTVTPPLASATRFVAPETPMFAAENCTVSTWTYPLVDEMTRDAGEAAVCVIVVAAFSSTMLSLNVLCPVNVDVVWTASVLCVDSAAEDESVPVTSTPDVDVVDIVLPPTLTVTPLSEDTARFMLPLDAVWVNVSAPDKTAARAPRIEASASARNRRTWCARGVRGPRGRERSCARGIVRRARRRDAGGRELTNQTCVRTGPIDGHLFDATFGHSRSCTQFARVFTAFLVRSESVQYAVA